MYTNERHYGKDRVCTLIIRIRVHGGCRNNDVAVLHPAETAPLPDTHEGTGRVGRHAVARVWEQDSAAREKTFDVDRGG